MVVMTDQNEKIYSYEVNQGNKLRLWYSLHASGN